MDNRMKASRSPQARGGPRATCLPGLVVLACVVALSLPGCAGSTRRSAQSPGEEPEGSAQASLTALATDKTGEADTGAEDLADLGAKAGLDQNLLERLAGEYESGGPPTDAEPGPADADSTSAALTQFAEDEVGADEIVQPVGANDRESTEPAFEATSLPADEVFLATMAEPAEATAEPDEDEPGGSEAGEGNPLLLLRERLEAEAERADTPFYEAVLTVMLDLYADGTTRRFQIPDTSDTFNDREIEVLRELQQFVDRIHRDVYRQDSPEPLVAAARDLADQLSGQLTMTIPTLELCKRVDGFGQYEPLAGRKFLVNRSNRIGIYAELANFGTRVDAEGQHRVEVSQTISLYNEFGTKAWEEGPERFVDTSRNRRRDFFLAVAVDLPPLSVGAYNLKVSMRDESSGAVAEKTIEIEVIADPRMTAGFD
jgi:hypothetical protein